jgi:uncharacterized SAM-binding protein YcdF (DUF218 family)/glycosyltransferase involved in cell wall biosynthesis
LGGVAVSLKGADIICFSSIDWDFIWQGHQEIMAALAEQGNRVLFVDNTGVRTPVLRDLPRVGRRVRNWWRGTQGFRQERPNLFVYSPLVLPLPYVRVARWLNRALMARSLRRWMQATGFSPAVVWTFLPTQLVVDLIDRLDADVVVYYCIADFEHLVSHAEQISRSELALVARSDVLFVQGESFRQRFGHHPNIHIFPFGVRMAAFETLPAGAPELADVKRPIIGYVGGVHQHVDQTLVERLAQEIDGTIVLVGPEQTDVDRLRKLDRVRFLGQQPHERLPDLIRAFDVGIIPYLRSPYTETVYPTKLNEYLAAGIPVVTTALPEVERFNDEFGGVVRVAPNTDAFVNAVRAAVADHEPDAVARRIDVARRNSWEVRIEKMSDLLEQTLVRRRRMTRPWEERLRRLYRRSRGRAAGVAVMVATIYFVLFATPFVWWVADPLHVARPPETADAIVVLAGGVGESGKAGGGYQERVKHAVILYRAGYASTLIFSSGYEFAFSEAELMKELAIAHGVPASAIVLETKGDNTYTAALRISQILAESGWRRVLLVSSPYHMRRALLTWRKSAPMVEVVPTPVADSQFYNHTTGATLEQMRGIVHEYAAICAYWWRGWI